MKSHESSEPFSRVIHLLEYIAYYLLFRYL